MTAIRLTGAGKSYRWYARPRDRFWELLNSQSRHQERVALEPVTLEVGHGEVIGVVGINGAGKSTLLKLIAGTAQPSVGQVAVTGRMCALLELGAGFHPDMTGRDNIFLGGAVAGMTRSAMLEHQDNIIRFAELADVIDQPVKAYSSGMVTRLAFAVATSVDPDILILDETLSVGDGNFARKSFERIMAFREAGKTILFCSHSMYQVQAICSRVLWLDRGRLCMDGTPAEVVGAYSEHLEMLANSENGRLESASDSNGSVESVQELSADANSFSRFRLLQVSVAANGVAAGRLSVQSGQTDVSIEARFTSDPALEAPTIGIMIVAANGRPVASASTLNDGLGLSRDDSGIGGVTLVFPKFPLLNGSYWVHVFLLCDRGLMVHDKARMVAELVVTQETLEQGVVTLPHAWRDLGVNL